MRLAIRSIRRFLIVAMVLLITVSGLITLVTNYEETHEQVEELFDAELAQMARMLQSILANQLKRTNLDSFRQALVYEDIDELRDGADSEDEETHGEYSQLGHKYEKKLAFQIWHEDGRRLIHTRSAAEYGFQRMPAGFNYIGSEWRTFTLHDQARKLWIQVAQKDDVRSELTQRIALQSLWPSLILITLLLSGISWVIRRGLEPLGRISAQLEQRSADNLSTLDTQNYPSELEAVVVSINRLFQRLQLAMERERRFTADAAHELRTPLAATKVHLENALVAIDQLRLNEGQTDSGLTDVTRSSLRQSLRGLSRLIHLVEQLLQLSRLDQEHENMPREPVPLDGLVREQIRETEDLAAQKEIEVRFLSEGNPIINGNPSMLRILLRNLLDNAIRYSPEQSLIRVSLDQRSLTVEDQGPGIPEEQKSRIFERFYRGQQGGESGSGLGLSISQEIARLHQASISLEEPATPPGLKVVVRFAGPGGH